MNAYHLKPGPPLSDFVDVLWLYVEDRQGYARERALPTGTVELVVHLGGETIRLWEDEATGQAQTFHGPVLCGPHSEYFVLDSSYQDAVLGAHFKPGGAYPFLGLPASELQNGHVALGDLWGSLAVKLQERATLALTPGAKLRALELALLERCPNPDDRHPAVGFALAELERARAVSDVIAQMGLSAKRFIDLFSDQVGLTPKLFHRVRRFQKVLGQVYDPRPLDWAGLALNCGYFDQAHFIHDFRAFSGLTPTDYVALRGRHANHVPVTD